MDESALPLLFSALIVAGIPTAILYFWVVYILRNRYPHILSELLDNTSISLSGAKNSWNVTLFFVLGRFRQNEITSKDQRIFVAYRWTLIVYMVFFICIATSFLYILAPGN